MKEYANKLYILFEKNVLFLLGKFIRYVNLNDTSIKKKAIDH